MSVFRLEVINFVPDLLRGGAKVASIMTVWPGLWSHYTALCLVSLSCSPLCLSVAPAGGREI